MNYREQFEKTAIKGDLEEYAVWLESRLAQVEKDVDHWKQCYIQSQGNWRDQMDRADKAEAKLRKLMSSQPAGIFTAEQAKDMVDKSGVCQPAEQLYICPKAKECPLSKYACNHSRPHKKYSYCGKENNNCIPCVPVGKE